MIRADMVTTVGREYLVSNIENDEFSYPKAYRAAAFPFTPIQNSSGRTNEKLDICFLQGEARFFAPHHAEREQNRSVLC